MNHLLSSRGRGIGIRLGVKSTGCSGLTYILEYVDEAKNSDLNFKCDNIQIFINSNEYDILKDVTVDYVKNGLNYGFEFVNPKEKNRCGCGLSFNI